MLTTRLVLPEVGALALTRAALGVGAGLLVAERMPPSVRRRVGWTLLAVGVATTAPLVARIVRGVEHAPTTTTAPGRFVRVGGSPGVVVDQVEDVPEDHVAVWYGETEDEAALVRTVPVEYCDPGLGPRTYH